MIEGILSAVIVLLSLPFVHGAVLSSAGFRRRADGNAIGLDPADKEERKLGLAR